MTDNLHNFARVINNHSDDHKAREAQTKQHRKKTRFTFGMKQMNK